jgi:hypothetical protein
MAYKRKDLQRPEKPHKLQENWGSLGQINTMNDPGWIHPNLVELMDDGGFALSQFQAAIESAKNLDMTELKPEIAMAKRTELVLKARRASLTFLKKHVEKFKSDMNAVSNKILRVTEPASPSDPMKAMLQQMAAKEIRDNLRNINPKDRRAAIAGNLERMQAVISNPDLSDIIIGAEALTELRREFAFKQDPSLIEEEKDQREVYKAVRARAGEINATAAKMLILSKLDDPLPPVEHFEIFTPETEHEQAYADRRVQLWQEAQNKIENDKKFAEKNEGVNLQAGERAVRIARGIPH